MASISIAMTDADLVQQTLEHLTIVEYLQIFILNAPSILFLFLVLYLFLALFPLTISPR